MKSIMQRFATTLWSETVSDGNIAVEWYESLTPTSDYGELCWTDIDYTDQTRSVWDAANHYARILHILKAFGKRRLLNDSEYAKKLTGALRFWLHHDFTNPNWWYNQIGMPQGIGNILLLMYPVLDADTLSQAINVMKKGSMSENPAMTKKTGANLIWHATNTIRYALLTENPDLLLQATKRASEEITIESSEGIQRDYSFFQHGPRLYAGGYGYNFANDLARIMFLVQGTKFQFPTEKIRIFNTYVLDGLQYMTHKGALDWACIGREISRADSIKTDRFQRTLELMIATQEMPRKQELQAFLNALGGEAQPNKTKYFDIAAMVCHHFNGIYVGAKFSNPHTWGAELCNDEGALCYNMSYGTHTCIMKSGREYVNINPVWDYSRIPGTTARTETDEQLLAHTDWHRYHLPNECFGGAQKGNRAAIYELAEHDGIQALVCNFAFEDGFVCLGANVQDQKGRNEQLITTVDQCFLSGDVNVEGTCISHNGIRYSALDYTNIHIAKERKTGSWRRNSAALSDELVSADILTLTIAHPIGEKSKYAYMISASDKDAPQITVLQNDSKAQAIKLPNGDIMAVFYRDTTITADGIIIVGKAGDILC